MSSPNLLPLIQFNHQHRVRSLVVFYGSHSWCLQQVQPIISEYENGLYVAKSRLPSLSSWQCIEEKKFRTQLGREWDSIIYDAQDGVIPDVLGALSGCIKSGGLCVLCIDPAFIKDSYFHQWLEYQIKLDPHVWCYNEAGQMREGKYVSLVEESHIELDSVYATTDQQRAVEAIKKVLTGHRNRPLILTADRGRGKTFSLGLAARELLIEHERDLNIIVTAPKQSAVENLFKQLNKEQRSSVSFVAPDFLTEQLPECDLLLVDEAAAIPVPLLEKWAIHYKRIVFSSTVHGYEGAGRGFTLKFNKSLQDIAPEYRKLHLKQPIRWTQGCPLEAFIFNALLLKNDLISIEKTSISRDIIFRDFDFSLPIEKNQELLKQAFSILISAHYQTSPNDLKNLLDLKETQLSLAIYDDKVIGAVLTVEEGAIDISLCQDILKGNRRIKGHLIAQSLMTHSGMVEAGTLQSWRVMRIAVHPQLQYQGVGASLIRYLTEKAKKDHIDYLSTSYGATASLVSFWRKQEFKSSVLGITKDAASGTYSVQSVLPISSSAQTLTSQIREHLRFNLPYFLSTKLVGLSPSLVVQLAKDVSFHKPNQWVLSQIHNYIEGYIGAELIGASLNMWLWHKLSTYPLNELDKQVKSSVQLKAEIAFLIERVLFAKSWSYLVLTYGKTLSISGQRQAKLKLLGIIKGLT